MSHTESKSIMFVFIFEWVMIQRGCEIFESKWWHSGASGVLMPPWTVFHSCCSSNRCLCWWTGHTGGPDCNNYPPIVFRAAACILFTSLGIFASLQHLLLQLSCTPLGAYLTVCSAYTTKNISNFYLCEKTPRTLAGCNSNLWDIAVFPPAGTFKAQYDTSWEQVDT